MKMGRIMYVLFISFVEKYSHNCIYVSFVYFNIKANISFKNNVLSVSIKCSLVLNIHFTQNIF